LRLSPFRESSSVDEREMTIYGSVPDRTARLGVLPPERTIHAG
jgi:hypothetical protein